MTVEELIAKSEIREVLHDYCRSMDRLDRDLCVSVFHPEAELFYEGMFAGTAPEFFQWIFERHQSVRACSHQLTSTTIRVAGDRAVSETYGTIAIQSDGDEGWTEERTTRGRYLDTWSRRNQRWAIERRHHVVDMRSTHCVRAETTDISGHGARRDKDDPSYRLLG
jgi:SnoaL-like domain